MNKLFIFGIAFVVIWALLTYVAGVTYGTMTTVILIGAILFTVQAIGLFKVLPIPLKKQLVGILALVLWGVFAWQMGYLAKYIPGLGVPAAVITPTVVPTGECAAGQLNFGDAATADINCWDLESNTPRSAAVDAAHYVYQDGAYKSSNSDCTGTTFNTEVGKSISIYGQGETSTINSYYVDAVENFCIDGERPTVDVEVHRVVNVSSLHIYGYKDDGTTALTTGTVDEEDYEIALGADEDYSFYLKFKMNTSDRAFQFCGVATVANGDVDECKPTESGYTREGAAKFLTDTDVTINQTKALNISGYDYFWRYPTTVLHEWDSIKHEFLISSDATGTAALDGASATSSTDACIVLFLDCDYARDQDGNPVFDYYIHDANENQVGIDVDEDNPKGAETGVIIEAT